MDGKSWSLYTEYGASFEGLVAIGVEGLSRCMTVFPLLPGGRIGVDNLAEWKLIIDLKGQ